MSFISRILLHGSDSAHKSKNYGVESSDDASGNGGNDRVELSIKIESPPIMLYGPPEESTGSILSGILKLVISDDGKSHHYQPEQRTSNESSAMVETNVIEFESVTLALMQSVAYSKPFVLPSTSINGCKKCASSETELARWDVVTGRHFFPSGTHGYPFSHLLPGSLPASCKLGSQSSQTYISYYLVAKAKIAGQKEFKVDMPINIARSILRGPDRNSLRVFPPTAAIAKAVLPNIIYPKSNFPLELRFDNMYDPTTKKRLKLRKLSWKVDENTKVQAKSCPSHIGKLLSMEKSQKKVSSSPKPQKSTSLHHSSIRTGMTYEFPPTNNPNNAENSTSAQVSREGSPPNYSTDHSPLHPFISSDNSDVNSHDEMSISSDRTPNSRQPADEAHLYLEESRTISYGEFKSGWKSDYSTTGVIEVVLNVNVSSCSTGVPKHEVFKSSKSDFTEDLLRASRSGANCAADIQDPSLGIFVSHSLIVEAYVVEEQVQIKKERAPSFSPLTPSTSSKSINSTNPASNSTSPNQNQLSGTFTGVARVLRMQFKVILTERSGLGIAWDDEVPPTYTDVSALSPPDYSEAHGSDLVPTASLSSRFSSPSLSQLQISSVLEGQGDTPDVNPNLNSDSNSPNDRINEFSL